MHHALNISYNPMYPFIWRFISAVGFHSSTISTSQRSSNLVINNQFYSGYTSKPISFFLAKKNLRSKVNQPFKLRSEIIELIQKRKYPLAGKNFLKLKGEIWHTTPLWLFLFSCINLAFIMKKYECILYDCILQIHTFDCILFSPSFLTVFVLAL